MDRTAQLHHYFYIGPAFLEESLEYCVLCGAERTAGYCGRRADCAVVKQKSEGMRFFRTIFYLPTVVSSVAVSLLWMWILEPNFGLLNTFLKKIGIIGPGWLTDPAWSKNSLILMSLWTVGGGMLIYLAALQDVPESLYEAATIDGSWRI